MPLLPPRLTPGSTIALVAPASAPPDPKAIDHSIAVLERLGFKPKLARNVRKRLGFLAGTDRERAGDLMTAFTDRKVNAILCIRGGYGSSRLLPLLDYSVIRSHPKIFVGYSDITSLHCALLKKANLVSFHGPMLNSDFIKKDFPDFTLHSFLRTLMIPSPPGSIRANSHAAPKSDVGGSSSSSSRKAGGHHNANGLPSILPLPFPKGEGRGEGSVRGAPSSSKHARSHSPTHPLTHSCQPSALRRGRASGPLIGGNISLICATLGTPYQPSFKNCILFFEDLDEVPYRFDRMLTHLLNAGVLQQVSGIAIGINANCHDPKAKTSREYRQTLEDVFRERLLPLRIPIVSNLPFGHVPLNATLPIGIRALLDADKADLLITAAAVH